VLKLVDITDGWMGTMDDVRAYFTESDDKESPLYNPYED